MAIIGGMHQRGPALFVRLIDGFTALKQFLQVIKITIG